MAFGGDELHAGPMHQAGSGVSAGLGLTFMPLWFHGHGLGINLEAGYQFDGGQNQDAGVNLERVPLLAAIDVLFHVVNNVFIRLAAGPAWHTGIQISGTGMGEDITVELPTALGFIVEGGPALSIGSFYVNLALRYTSMEYDVPPTVDASSLGLHFAFQYVLL